MSAENWQQCWSATPDDPNDDAACWRTPPEVFRPLNREFHFGLDAAARQGTQLVPWWIGPNHPNPDRRNAFTADWRACKCPGAQSVFVNPPYGGDVFRWMRLARRWSDHMATVALVMGRTDVPWFHMEVMPYAAELRFVRGRITFLRVDGSKATSAPAPSVVIVWRPGHVGPPKVSTFNQEK